MKFFKRLLKKQGRASRINVVPPKPYENRQGVALVLIVKNEQDTLKDWLAFHTLAGVSNFYVYDNGSTDNTKQIVKSFTGAGFEYIPWAFNGTTHERNVFLPQQILAYSHAICTFGASHEWMGFIDADEYIVPTGSDCIATVLDNNKDRPNLSLPWVMFGHSGHADRPKAPLPFAFV
ncbi:MAG: glycosyltransferase family 92 protein, partial [Pseudomonadota bacterium]